MSCVVHVAFVRACAQIRFILLQNRQGKTRLAKYYAPFDDQEKRKLEDEVHRLITTRDPKFTNFLEVCRRTQHAFRIATPSSSCVCAPETVREKEKERVVEVELRVSLTDSQ